MLCEHETIAVRNTRPNHEASESAAGCQRSQYGHAPAADASAALKAFHAALKDLESGQRNKPVTVLHLGDGHVSGDRLDAHMRTLLQSRFGDAGRGMMLPAGVLKGYRARGLRFETAGNWTGATALEATTAVLGLSGVTATAASAQAEMSVSMNEGRFDSVEVAFLAGPDRGAASIGIDGRPHSVVTRARRSWRATRTLAVGWRLTVGQTGGNRPHHGLVVVAAEEPRGHPLCGSRLARRRHRHD